MIDMNFSDLTPGTDGFSSEEIAWLEFCKTGLSSDFETWMHLAQPRIRGLVKNQLGTGATKEDIEDAFSEVYCHFFRIYRKYDSNRSRPAAFITVVARSKSRDVAKKLRLYTRNFPTNYLSEQIRNQDGDDYQPISEPKDNFDLEQAVETSELYTEFRSTLSDNEQQVLNMLRFGYTKTEMATALRTTEGNIRQISHRIRMKLRKFLGLS